MLKTRCLNLKFSFKQCAVKEIYDSFFLEEEDVFKSNRSAPACDDLKAFENDLSDTIKNIKFSTYKSNFQRKLKQDLNKLLIKNKIILFEDKEFIPD